MTERHDRLTVSGSLGLVISGDVAPHRQSQNYPKLFVWLCKEVRLLFGVNCAASRYSLVLGLILGTCMGIEKWKPYSR